MPTVTIKLTEDEIKFIKPSQEECQTANVGFHHACHELEISRKKLWAELEKIRPEAMGRGTKFNGKAI